MNAFFVSMTVLVALTAIAVVGFKHLFLKKEDKKEGELSEFDKVAAVKNEGLDVFRYSSFYRIIGFATTIVFTIILIEYSVGAVIPPDVTAGPVEKQVTREVNLQKVEPPKPKPKKSNKPRKTEVKKDDELIDTTVKEQVIDLDNLLGGEDDEEIIEEAEEEEVAKAPAEPIRNPTVKAVFPGQIRSWIYNNLEVPEEDKAKGTKGLIVVGWIVGIDGSVSDVEIKKPLTPSLNQAVLQLFTQCPTWKPASHLGQVVPQIWECPIMIRGN